MVPATAVTFWLPVANSGVRSKLPACTAAAVMLTNLTGAVKSTRLNVYVPAVATVVSKLYAAPDPDALTARATLSAGAPLAGASVAV